MSLCRLAWPATLISALTLLLVACGGGGSGSSGPSSEQFQFLLQHNARFNDGLTIRWPTLPIRVFTNNIAQQDEVREWERATGGAVTFTFVGSRSAANIAFRFGASGNDEICGLATVEFTGDGVITFADIQVVQAVFRGPLCGRTVVHEVGHGIGFLDHSADGGLMDPDGGSGEFTSPVVSMIRLLYSLAPGTPVGSAERVRAARSPRGGGRYVVTIVDPVRR